MQSFVMGDNPALVYSLSAISFSGEGLSARVTPMLRIGSLIPVLPSVRMGNLFVLFAQAIRRISENMNDYGKNIARKFLVSNKRFTFASRLSNGFIKSLVLSALLL